MLRVSHLKSALLMQPDWYCGRLVSDDCHTTLVLKPPDILKSDETWAGTFFRIPKLFLPEL